MVVSLVFLGLVIVSALLTLSYSARFHTEGWRSAALGGWVATFAVVAWSAIGAHHEMALLYAALVLVLAAQIALRRGRWPRGAVVVQVVGVLALTAAAGIAAGWAAAGEVVVAAIMVVVLLALVWPPDPVTEDVSADAGSPASAGPA
jgi:hypothetical protein